MSSSTLFIVIDQNLSEEEGKQSHLDISAGFKEINTHKKYVWKKSIIKVDSEMVNS